MTTVQQPNTPTGELIMANARLLDESGEAMYGRPVTTYLDMDEDPSDTSASVANVYDPFTGISAGPLEDLDKLVCLTNNQGFVWVQIAQPPTSLFGISVPTGLSTLPLTSTADIHADPYPLVGIYNMGTGKWVILPPIKESESVLQTPSTIGSFNRFELSQAAIPGKIEVLTLSGQALQEYNIGGATLGVTFRKQDLPAGFFIYDHLSQSLFVSDDTVTQISVDYHVPPFTVDIDTNFRPRKLIPNSQITVLDPDLASANLIVYPDVRLYLHFDYDNIIRKTAMVVFENPLSKLEESRRYGEG